VKSIRITNKSPYILPCISPFPLQDIVFLVDSIEAIAKTRNPLVFVKYHNLLALGAKRFDDNTQSKEDTCLSKMTDLVSKMESKELLLVSRLITHSLTMVNIAETRHRFRVIHEEEKVSDRSPGDLRVISE